MTRTRRLNPADLPVPEHDGFYSTFVLRRVSRRITVRAVDWGWTPNGVTLAALGVALVAAAAFAVGGRTALVVGAVVLQVAIVIDCVDGELARATNQFSARGAWLDGWTDRIKEYAVYAGLALGSVRHGEDVWLLAASTLTVQVFAHLGAFGFDLHVADAAAADAGPGSVAAWSERTSRRGWLKWAKRVAHFQIGERWLVISVVAAVSSPRWVFVALLVLGALAATYSYAGRLLRSLHLRPAAGGRRTFAALLDAGPLAALVGVPDRRPPLSGRWRWLPGPVLRLVEYSVVIALVALVGAPDDGVRPVVAFAVLFALCLLHYDAVYRARVLAEGPPTWVRLSGLGVDGRLVVVVALASLGASVLGVGLVVLAGWFAVLDLLVAAEWLHRTATREASV